MDVIHYKVIMYMDPCNIIHLPVSVITNLYSMRHTVKRSHLWCLLIQILYSLYVLEIFQSFLPAETGVKIIKFYGPEKICQWNLDANWRKSACKWSCGNLHGPIKRFPTGLTIWNPVISLFLPPQPAYLASLICLTYNPCPYFYSPVLFNLGGHFLLLLCGNIIV